MHASVQLTELRLIGSASVNRHDSEVPQMLCISLKCRGHLNG